MATWITHLMVADGVLDRYPTLDRRGFCVGNIAPDCNIENEDWTAFTPPREVTHWMSGDKKKASDADAFCNAYIIKRNGNFKSPEEYAFLLGYYSHLIVDAAFQLFIRDEERVKNIWKRIYENEEYCKQAQGYDETWDLVKRLIPKNIRLREIAAIEVEYLRDTPDSGYLTEILPLKEFPDYIDYLPEGCIVRKIGIMGGVPETGEMTDSIFITKEEILNFVKQTRVLVEDKFSEMGLV